MPNLRMKFFKFNSNANLTLKIIKSRNLSKVENLSFKRVPVFLVKF